MAKYIDVEKLQLEPDPWGGMNGVLISIGRSSGKTVKLVQDALRCMVDHAPAEDVVPVVRCKDCECYDPGYIRPYCGWCSTWETAVRESGYCHHGERRTK